LSTKAVRARNGCGTGSSVGIRIGDRAGPEPPAAQPNVSDTRKRAISAADSLMGFPIASLPVNVNGLTEWESR